MRIIGTTVSLIVAGYVVTRTDLGSGAIESLKPAALFVVGQTQSVLTWLSGQIRVL